MPYCAESLLETDEGFVDALIDVVDVACTFLTTFEY